MGDDTALINYVKGRKHCESTENSRAVPAETVRFRDCRSSPQNDSESITCSIEKGCTPYSVI